MKTSNDTINLEKLEVRLKALAGPLDEFNFKIKDVEGLLGNGAFMDAEHNGIIWNTKLKRVCTKAFPERPLADHPLRTRMSHVADLPGLALAAVEAAEKAVKDLGLK